MPRCIKPEAVNLHLFHPEPGDINHFIAHLLVIEIQIRHMTGKESIIVLGS